MRLSPDSRLHTSGQHHRANMVASSCNTTRCAAIKTIRLSLAKWQSKRTDLEFHSGEFGNAQQQLLPASRDRRVQIPARSEGRVTINQARATNEARRWLGSPLQQLHAGVDLMQSQRPAAQLLHERARSCR